MKKKRIKRLNKSIKVPANIVFSYKQPEVLSKFVTEQGSIISKAESGLNQKQQRHLATAIKRARHLALMEFTQTV